MALARLQPRLEPLAAENKSPGSLARLGRAALRWHGASGPGLGAQAREGVLPRPVVCSWVSVGRKERLRAKGPAGQ